VSYDYLCIGLSHPKKKKKKKKKMCGKNVKIKQKIFFEKI